jgi:hypothetical protein
MRCTRYSTGSSLVSNQRHYPYKAILGTACELATGRGLEPGDFEGAKPEDHGPAFRWLSVPPAQCSAALSPLVREVSAGKAFQCGAQQVSLGHPAAEALADGDGHVPRE